MIVYVHVCEGEESGTQKTGKEGPRLAILQSLLFPQGKVI